MRKLITMAVLMMAATISASAAKSWPTEANKLPNTSWPTEVTKFPKFPDVDCHKFPSWPSSEPSWPIEPVVSWPEC